MADGTLHYTQTLSNEQFKASLAESAGKVRDFNRQVVSGADEMGNAFSSLGNKIAAAFSVMAVVGFGKKVFETRAYFQDIESSMKVFLGSAEKAANFTQKLKDYAYYNMFEFKDLARASQQLIAYGNSVEDVIPIIDKLSNIATGTKVPLDEMVSLYNKAKNLGSVGAQGLQSWAAKGLVLTDILKEMGEEVDGTKISFEQLNKALDKVTGEGGMFHGLMEEMMPNLSSSWGQLQDNLANMFDEIGKSAQESMRAGIDAASWVVDHYKEIGKVLLEVIAIYGSYKAALLVITAIERVRNLAMFVKEWVAMARALGIATANQIAFNSATMANPYGLVAAAIAAVVAALVLWGNENDKLASATAEVSKNVTEQTKELDELKRKVESATTSEEERRKALDQFNEMHSKYQEYLNDEKVTVDNLTQSYKDLKQAIIESAIADAKTKYTKDSSTEKDRRSGSLANAVQSLSLSESLKGELQSFLENGIASGRDPIDLINEFRGRYRSTDRETFQKLMPNRTDVSSLNTALAKYWKSVKDYDKDMADFEEWAQGYRKGFEEEAPKSSTGTNFQNYVKNKRKEYQDAKKEYEALMKDGEATKEQVDRAKEAMEDAAKALKDYGYNVSGKKMTTAEKSAYRQERYSKAVTDELAAQEKRQQNEIDAARLAAMQEGQDKEREALNQNKEQELYDLGVWQKKMLDAELENQRTAYKERTGKEAPADMALESTDTVLDIIDSFWRQKDAIDEKYRIKGAQQDKKQAEQAEKDRVEYLIQYGGFQEQKKAITEKYAKLIADAENEWQKKSLAKQRDAELWKLEMQNNLSLKNIFADPADKSMATLKKNLQDAHKLMETLEKDLNDTENGEGSNIEKIKLLQEQIDNIRKAINDAEGIDWTFGINDAIPALNSILVNRRKIKSLMEEADKAKSEGDKNEAERLRVEADNLADKSKKTWETMKKNALPLAANTLADGLAKAADYAAQLAEITGDTKLADWAEEAGALAQNFQAAGQGAAQGGWIGAVVGGVSDMISQTFSARLEAKAWVKQFEASIKDFRSAIELADIVFNSNDFEDMFGTRSLESAIDAFRAINDLSEKYTEHVTAAFELGERQKRNTNKGAGIFGGVIALGGAGWEPWTGFIKKTTQKWYSELDAYDRGMTKLQAIQVRVKKKSGWAKLWGAQDKYQSLFDVAPELWGGDINGEFDVEKAKKFLETSKQLTDEQRKQIELAIQYKEEWDKAQEALDNVIEDTVGSFADDMADAVWEGITKGANAWEVFRDKGNEALVSLGKQMLKEFAINTYLEQFKDKLRSAYGSGDTAAIAKIYTEIFDGIPVVLENMTIAGQQWIDLLRENGYDVTQEGATSGSQGNGYRTEMSHEDASEINGRLTDIQMQMRLGVASISSIKNDTDIIRVQTVQAVDHLYRIERNTAMLSSIDGRLGKIEKNTANL